MKAKWGIDYDYKTDKCFKRPVCPECETPIFKHETEYECVSCQKPVQVDSEMLKWLEDREGEKVEMTDCFRCKGKGTLETHYFKNDVTLEWEAACGECKACGMRFIV